MRHRFLFPLILVLATNAAAETPRAGELLERSWQAMGGAAWDDVSALETEQSIETSGLSGKGKSVEDLQSGHYVNSYDLGAITGSDGFDGEHPWDVDPNGAVTVSETADEVEYAHNTAYRTMRAFWYPKRHAADVRWDRGETLDGVKYDVLRVAPQGGRPFELWLDAKTGYIARTVETLAIGTETTIYGDYRDVDGLMLPHHVRVTEGDPRFDFVVSVTGVTVNPPVAADAFDVPKEATSEIEMAGDSITVPFHLVNNHIFVEAKLNGQGPFTLLVDTGGANILIPDAMRRLGLAATGALRGRGAGEGTTEISVTRVDRLAIGGMAMTDQTFYGIDLAEIERAGGFPFDGLVGYEVFKRFAVRIDYERGQLTLTRPEAFHYTGDAQAIPFVFDGNTPQVEGAVDGYTGTFTLDTGSRVSLDIMVPFAERNGLVDRYGTGVEAVTGWGVGGPTRSVVSRAGMLRLGPVEVHDILLDIARQKSGSFTDRYRAGNVGGGVLKQFTVIFDYREKQLWLEPNGWYGRPDRYDRSGMWLNLADGGFEVIDVVDRGPAAKAGLRPGDVITAIGGRNAADWKLYDLRQALRDRDPGERLAVTFLRGDERRKTRITLRELVP